MVGRPPCPTGGWLKFWTIHALARSQLTLQQLGQVHQGRVVHVALPLGHAQHILRVQLRRRGVKVDEDDLGQVAVQLAQVLDVVPVHVLGAVAEQTVDDALLGVNVVHHAEGAHRWLRGVDDQLEVWVAHHVQEVLQGGPLLEPVAGFVLNLVEEKEKNIAYRPLRRHQHVLHLDHQRVLGLMVWRGQRVGQQLLAARLHRVLQKGKYIYKLAEIMSKVEEIRDSAKKQPTLNQSRKPSAIRYSGASRDPV